MRKLIIALLFAAAALPAVSFAEGGANLDKVQINLSDKAALRNGANMFVHYCLSCHSAHFERYNRMAKDLGIPVAQVKDHMMFASKKVGSLMTVAMTPAQGKEFFGNAPPDLSVIARAKSPDYLYTYLRGFYLDPSRPFGVNNVAFKDVAMPDVVWHLQGLREPIYKMEKDADGQPQKVISGFKWVKKGTMTPKQFNKQIHDLVNFLVYLGEPARLVRTKIGVWVLVFLAILFVFSYMLKKEYWKDVH